MFLGEAVYLREHDREYKLLECANGQGGYFTAKQAFKAGYSYRLHSYHVRSGRWIRIERGIFRLQHYPSVEREDLIRWTLWSRNQRDKPQAVASHETALAIHDLSDVMPARTHLTVPPGFRKRVPGGCILHRFKLEPESIEKREGFLVTTPLQTLRDVAEGNLSEDELLKALKDALDRGLVRLKKIDVTRMSERGKLRMLMAIKGIGERKG